MNININKANILTINGNTVFEYYDENNNLTGFMQGGKKESFFAWVEDVVRNEEDEIIDYFIQIQHEGSNIFLGYLSDIKANGVQITSMTMLFQNL